MTNINDPWPDDEITTALDDLPEVDPPATLVQNVMSTIASRGAAPAIHSLAIPTKRGEIMAKKVLWVVAAAAAVALITMRFVGYPPVEKGTEATIGAAQRYQSPQISSADVKTQDPQLQAFLQSDLFRQLTTDKAARQALQNKDFQKALQTDAVRVALAAPDVRYAIAAAKVSGDAVMLKNDMLRVALEASPALRLALASPDVVAALGASNALGVALSKADVAMQLSKDAMIAAMLSAPDAAMDAAAAAGGAAGSVRQDAAPSVVR